MEKVYLVEVKKDRGGKYFAPRHGTNETLDYAMKSLLRGLPVGAKATVTVTFDDPDLKTSA